MSRTIEYEAPTWNQTYKMLLDIADRIRDGSFKPDAIIGVSRGGLLPARILSDLLNNANLATVGAELYVGISERKSEPRITQPLSANVKVKSVLVVDEVTDTGRSLKLVREHVKEQGATMVRTATIYCKPWSKMKPDYYEKETDRWIVFPWELKETVGKVMKQWGKDPSLLQEQKTKLTEAGVSTVLFNRFMKEIIEEEDC